MGHTAAEAVRINTGFEEQPADCSPSNRQRCCSILSSSGGHLPASCCVCSLHTQQEKTRRDELHKEKDKLQGQVAELGGMVKSQQRLLELEKVCWGGADRMQLFLASSIHTVKCCLPGMQRGLAAARGGLVTVPPQHHSTL